MMFVIKPVIYFILIFKFNQNKNVILSLSQHYSRTRVFAKCAQWVAKDPMSLHADSELSLLGAPFSLLVLSCCGSYVN